MPDNTIAAKTEQLGMPYGTANSQLRKTLLFEAVRRLGENFCYRCALVIDDVADFSIDHKQPWLHVDPALFWDVSNIAYSHGRCNSMAARRAENPGLWNRKIGPPGTAWCRYHKNFIPVGLFAKNASRWNGLQKVCREHHNGGRRVKGVSIYSGQSFSRQDS